MKGRKPLPAAVRAQRAPVRSSRKPPEAGVAINIGDVKPTRKLSPLALQVWNALAPRLVAAKLLGDLDAAAFTRYCQLTARFEQAELELDADGLIYWSESAHGKLKRANPAALLQLRFSRELASLEGNFGLNPADRQRIFADRARQGVPGDLFGGAPNQKAAPASEEPAKPASSPVGFLN